MDLSWPLERAALVHGDAVAVVDGERSLTYRELAARVGALGAALGELGLGEGAASATSGRTRSRTSNAGSRCRRSGA